MELHALAAVNIGKNARHAIRRGWIERGAGLDVLEKVNCESSV